MARGLPDYGVSPVRTTIFPVTDLSELAVRLGSPNTHDRAGDVLWWDDMECGLAKWVAVEEGTGADVSESRVQARNGRISARLTAGSDGLALASIQHFQPIPTLSGFGFEAAWRNATAFDELEILAGVRDGVNLTNYGIRYVDATNQLQYLNSAAVWTNFGNPFIIVAEETLFHPWKLVVDSVLQQYVRFVLDDQVHDLSGIEGDSRTDPFSPVVDLLIRLNGRAGFNDVAYVDDVIFTQNEP